MSSNSWNQTLPTAQVAGPSITAASASTMLPAAARFTLPANILNIGTALHVRASGIITVVVTTPGTARYDFRVGAAVVFDSQAITMSTAGFSNVPWYLDLLLTCRSIGNSTNATIIGQGLWTCSASAAACNALPFSGAIGVGTGFDSTVSNTLDMFFTQTVATGSMTLQQYELALLN
jgi:hypothetical protein